MSIIAWTYELAIHRDRETGEYGGWEHHLSREKPCVPDGSIRNLVPLTAAVTSASTAELADDLESVANWIDHLPMVETQHHINACEAAAHHLRASAIDAARWQALMRTPRIRMYGSAGVDPKTGERTEGTHVHFGADFWSTSADEAPDGQSGSIVTEWGRHCLTALADAIIERESGK